MMDANDIDIGISLFINKFIQSAFPTVVAVIFPPDLWQDVFDIYRPVFKSQMIIKFNINDSTMDIG